MATRTRWPTSPTSGPLPATPLHAIRTGSWLAPEAPTDLRFRRRFVAGLCVTVGALSLLPLATTGSQYLPIAWSDIPGWSEDDHLAAFQTFRASCKPIAAQDAAALTP